MDNRERDTLDKRTKPCPNTPRAERYVSKADAEDAILDFKIKSAVNGSRASEDRVPEICTGCGGWHVVTRSRRARRAES